MNASSVSANTPVLLRIEGDLVIARVSGLKTKLLADWQVCQDLVLDLESVTECDTAGLQFLVAATRMTSQEGKTIRIGRCSDIVLTTAVKLGLNLVTDHDDQGALNHD